MNKKSLTRDEIYLVKLFEYALKLGNPYEEVDKYAIGRLIGQNDRSVNNIVKLLAQTNFIKKGEGNSIYLTPHGEQLVHSLKQI